MVKYDVSILQVNQILRLTSRIPQNIHNRWARVKEGLARMASDLSDDTPCVTVGSGRKTVKIRFNSHKRHLKAVYNILTTNHPALVQQFNLDCFSDSDRSPLKSIILAPDIENCKLCKSKSFYWPATDKVSFPIVFTKDGTRIAASYHKVCSNEQCRTAFHHSYYITKDKQKVYYDTCLEQKYLQTTNKTAFSLAYLEEVTSYNAMSGTSFQMMAKVYNLQFFKKHKASLSGAFLNGRKKCHQKAKALNLNKCRLETGWFTFHLIRVFSRHNQLEKVSFTMCQNSRRSDIEALCGTAADLICAEKSPWVDHKCNINGCNMNFMVIDGNAKVRRPMCAANQYVSVSENTPNIIKCCPRSPITGNKDKSCEEFCTDHLWMKDAILQPKPITPEIQNEERLKTFEYCSDSERNADIQLHDDDLTEEPERKNVVVSLRQYALKSNVSELFRESTKTLIDEMEPEREVTLVGCKKKKNVKTFYTKTAGVLCAVRPCGVIVGFTELYTSESLTQAFAFLLSLRDDGCKCDALAYDRSCQLEPYLDKLAIKGNKGAQELLASMEMMVDRFHCVKHTKPTCMPPPDKNPRNRFHPDCERFKRFGKLNTEIAESVFFWLGFHKRNTKRMTENRFFIYLHTVINIHNNYVVDHKMKKLVKARPYHQMPKIC